MQPYGHRLCTPDLVDTEEVRTLKLRINDYIAVGHSHAEALHDAKKRIFVKRNRQLK